MFFFFFLVWFFLFRVSEGPLFWTEIVLEALKGHSSTPALITALSCSVTQAPVCIPLHFCSAAFRTMVSAGEPEGLTCLVPSYKRLFENSNLAMSFSSGLLRPKLTDCECWLLSTPGCKNLRRKGGEGMGDWVGYTQDGAWGDMTGILSKNYDQDLVRCWPWGSKSELLVEYISHHIRVGKIIDQIPFFNKSRLKYYRTACSAT